MKRKIGLALGGGAGLGWAHIGVVKCLYDHGIKPDVISGTSIGAIVGACVAAGKLEEVEHVARNMTIREMLLLGQWGFGSGGLIKTDKIEKHIRTYLGTMTFDELPTSFSAVAADLDSGDRVELISGDVVNAVMASAAVPGVFPVREINDKRLIDGGVADPMPCESLINKGCNYIIGVDLQGDYNGRVDKLGLLDADVKSKGKAMKIARASVFAMLKNIGVERLKSYPADIVISPKVGHIEMADFTKADELIEIGYQATKDKIFELNDVVE